MGSTTTLVGSTLGRFRVDRLLGRGGMGAVYAAFDEKLERDVALKVLVDEEGSDLALQKKRLMREARLAARLTHPNIATIYEVDDIDGRLVIVMELLEGLTLRKILHTRKMLLDEAIAVGRDMARALAKAHSAGVIHRDIKPENVLVTTPTPDSILAKVLDFGLARQKPAEAPTASPGEKAEHTNTTSRGDMWGTPGYVSPEQAHNQPVDVRTDVFSFGVVFYEMVANIKPFRGDNAIQMMLATTRQEARPLREIVPDLPAPLDEIIRRCMMKKREDRFTDGTELSAALEAWAREGNVSTRLQNVVGHSPTGSSPNLAPFTPPSTPDSSRVPSEQRAGPRPIPNVPAAPSSEPSDGHNPTTGGSAAIELIETAASDDQLRRDRMKLVLAIATGLGIAFVVIVLVVALRSPKAAASGPAGPDSAVGAAEPPSTIVVPPPPAARPEPAASEEVAATLELPANPTVAAPANPSPSGRAPATHHSSTRSKKADCAQPFVIDSKGVKIPKMQCL